ncbi:hypothetical protein [Enterovirga rhinocerotis]|uniref:hypothetical protein n=1 Tax=Enterovirga rhinocerotis TaxID=1339210 RepID=UPI001061B342|nr:hypothetical protein [Enterovirga rhinocerotis]
MPTGRTDELTRQFGAEIADAITRAYQEAVMRAASVATFDGIGFDQRLALVQALIDEVEAGQTEPDHLRDVALIFIPPRAAPSAD